MNKEERDKFEELRELNEIVIKFARRVVHDMAHMHGDLCKHREIYPSSDEWWDRIQMWKAVFYPENGPKNYRSELCLKNARLEGMLEKYRKLLTEHKIPDPYFMDF